MTARLFLEEVLPARVAWETERLTDEGSRPGLLPGLALRTREDCVDAVPLKEPLLPSHAVGLQQVMPTPTAGPWWFSCHLPTYRLAGTGRKERCEGPSGAVRLQLPGLGPAQSGQLQPAPPCSPSPVLTAASRRAGWTAAVLSHQALEQCVLQQ